MALNNCDITSQSFDENLGSNLSGRSAGDRTLVISPQAGYVVDKSKFTIPNPLPTGVDSITLSDTGFPGEPDNTVQVVVGIASSYSASASNNVISLGITGSADLPVSPIGRAETVYGNAYVHVSNSATTNLTFAKTSSPGITFDGLNPEAVKADKALVLGVKTTLVKYSITADAGKRFLQAPTLTLINNNLEHYADGEVTLDVTKITKDANDNVTKYDFDLNYYSEVETFKEDDLSYHINFECYSIPTQTTEIKRVDFGTKDIGKNGATRKVKVYGDVGAKFDIEVKETGQSPFLSQTGLEITSIGKYYGTSKGVNHKDIDVVIPGKSTSTTYEIKITQGSGTTFNTTSMGGSSPQTFIINQFANPTVSFQAVVGNNLNFSAPANINKLGRPNKTNEELGYIKTLKPSFDLNYSLTTGDSSISVTKVPEFKLKERIGDVRSNDMDRIYMTNTEGLVTGMHVVEHSDDTSLPARVISSITAGQHVDVDVNFTSHGFNKEFTFVKSDWTEASIVPHLNGGTRVTISNITATASGQTATIKGRVNIKKFGNQNVVLQLPLEQILNDS